MLKSSTQQSVTTSVGFCPLSLLSSFSWVKAVFFSRWKSLGGVFLKSFCLFILSLPDTVYFKTFINIGSQTSVYSAY